MPKDQIDFILTALADPVRRLALQLLDARDELCVCELMEELDVTQSRMSRHMSTLKAAGLVLGRRDAQWVRYRRNPRVSAVMEAVVRSALAASPAPRSIRRVRSTTTKRAETAST